MKQQRYLHETLWVHMFTYMFWDVVCVVYRIYIYTAYTVRTCFKCEVYNNARCVCGDIHQQSNTHNSQYHKRQIEQIKYYKTNHRHTTTPSTTRSQTKHNLWCEPVTPLFPVGSSWRLRSRRCAKRWRKLGWRFARCAIRLGWQSNAWSSMCWLLWPFVRF